LGICNINNSNNENNPLIVGVGSTGSKITLEIVKEIKSEAGYLLLNSKRSNNKNENNIIIDPGAWINPSIYKIRESFMEKLEKILPIINNFSNIIIIGNLASKFGSAIIPMLTNILHKFGDKIIISFVIMPFGFEKERIFHSGLSLSFINKYSNSTIVVDNNSFLKNNPELSIPECFKITNNAIKDIIFTSFDKGFPNEFNVIATSKESNCLEDAFSRTFTMSNNSKIQSVEKTSMFVYPAQEKIDSIDSVVKTAEKIANESDNEINLINGSGCLSKIHFMIKTTHLLFSSYDPINQFVSINNFLDYEPETNRKIQEISYLKDIEAKIIQ
jgi:cell division protein FtsZ